MTNCDISNWLFITTCWNYAILIVLGHLRDFFHELFYGSIHKTPFGCAPLLSSFEDLYTRRIFRRVCDCWNRPIASRPGAYIEVMERISHDYNAHLELTGRTFKCLNLASYNYLGFAESPSHVQQQVLQSLDQFGVAQSSPYGHCGGYTQTHRDLEKTIARFVGQEDALIFSMGFATNSTTIPLLANSSECLIISDQLNHMSIVNGVRSSLKATVTVFKHNDMNHLERIVRKSILEGQPGSHKPWRMILIILEGIYSMEGEIANLKQAVEIKKKYGCYLYVDEAHSIGALGKTGRGVCEYCGVNPRDVDILMGTFTKSFGSVGGYVAANKEIIAHLRKNCYGLVYGSSMPTPCAQQALSALQVIMGEDGTDLGRRKLHQLNETSNYFREGLKKLGFEVISDIDSPVIITMLYNPSKCAALSRMCLEEGIAVVVVGAPATETLNSRVRFCVSAAHTKEDIDLALEKLDRLGDWTASKYKLFKSQAMNDLYNILF
ncbi:hypothetical protein C9374_010739 [Naegleria lovaniensis]|uniref:serine C-palmitoyltransferase n=1 Tax=Naegleria lovaniensis TaxID=51637 RepID=A0AA88GFC6_NAELO|nr:uncharacterized protein C9374_010739 [Naegleria lovaniensis]KAG2374455.1 hypothetical protein C9374_010739 [Naegleria lovaniensis]